MGALVARSVRRGGEQVWDIYQKDYVSSGEAQRRTKARSLWDEKEMNYQNAASELKKLFGKAVFTYAKPTYLVHRCMEMIAFDSGDWVLDFFAGSGTTGHAVMMENARDGIDRRFILCTNNENSICILFDTEKCDILITGDRSTRGEASLLSTGRIPELDALVAGHHGAAGSTGDVLLAATKPSVVLISVGEDNSYGHPHDAPLSRLRDAEVSVYRTDKMGHIIAVSDGTNITFSWQKTSAQPT